MLTSFKKSIRATFSMITINPICSVIVLTSTVFMVSACGVDGLPDDSAVDQSPVSVSANDDPPQVEGNVSGADSSPSSMDDPSGDSNETDSVTEGSGTADSDPELSNPVQTDSPVSQPAAEVPTVSYCFLKARPREPLPDRLEAKLTCSFGLTLKPVKEYRIFSSDRKV